MLLQAMAVITFVISILGFWGVYVLCQKQQWLLDVPNQRSNHVAPVIRAGGLVVISIILIMLLATYPSHWLLAPCLLLLSAVSLIDDIKSLSFAIRLLVQLAVVSVSVVVLCSNAPAIIPWLPHWLELVLIVIAWVWFINLSNFMDGINGITITHGVSVAIGFGVIALFAKDIPAIILNISYHAIIAVLVAFALFNGVVFSKAKLFLGDIGSIGLGYIIGYFLILLAQSGYLVVALLLPMYFLVDSTVTLIKRILNKERFWQAHSKHYYQRAVRNGKSHRHVCAMIALLNVVLLLLALSTVLYPVLQFVFLCCGLLVTWAFCVYTAKS